MKHPCKCCEFYRVLKDIDKAYCYITNLPVNPDNTNCCLKDKKIKK